MKKCSKCGVEKSLHDFYRRADSPYAECKPCTLARNEEAKQKRLALDSEREHERAREAGQRFRDRHVEQERQRQRDRHRANPHKAKERMQRWRQVDPERARAADKYWRVSNPTKVREGKSRRRQAEARMPPWVDKRQIEAVYAKALALGLEVDHVVPLQSKVVSGLHVWHNLQLLDKRLNTEKHNRYWPDMP